MTTQAAQAEWKQKTETYVQEVNKFVRRGLAEGWNNAGEEPELPNREHLVLQALAALRLANKEGNVEKFRQDWPLAHEPVRDIIDESGRDIPVVCILDDGSILARVGASYESGKTFRIQGDKATELSERSFFGRSPDRRYFGIARGKGIEILDGWQGPQVAFCPWPKGTEDIPDGVNVVPLGTALKPSRIVPFPDGKRVLMVSGSGIYVLTEGAAHRLVPTTKQIQEWAKENPKGEYSFDLSMEHGAISLDGHLIAVGCQDSSHLVFNGELKLIGDIGPRSEYPHYAIFSADQSMIAFNACHFYNGATVGVPTSLLPGLVLPPYSDDVRTPVLEGEARVYAGVSRADEFIVGDAVGYIRAFDAKGQRRWQQFIGSTICDIDVSKDGRTLVASTAAGYVSIFRLDAGKASPHQIGTGAHFEQRRWIFWKSERSPLVW